MEALVSQIPIDPFIALGLITFSCGGVGWLLGPVVGTGLFNVRNGATRKEMERKEREFFGRVKRFRVDPSASSVANPGGFPSLSYSCWCVEEGDVEFYKCANGA